MSNIQSAGLDSTDPKQLVPNDCDYDAAWEIYNRFPHAAMGGSYYAQGQVKATAEIIARHTRVADAQGGLRDAAWWAKNCDLADRLAAANFKKQLEQQLRAETAERELAELRKRVAELEREKAKERAEALEQAALFFAGIECYADKSVWVIRELRRLAAEERQKGQVKS